ncbi:sugar ABC transporter substrate-binding protein [Mycetocola miduiensis]|uniref:Monosaccharide ABC transporter substrate-binding protein, CUT2 family n=1 Tax=Mycetocola miduiensis TaxID=995034 RepID=A0A1I5CE87_9MICO|nr:substrate-binding domain-containing protein [Mycetocola miduiensis]SFN85330.1 monosaccharide ABC transporter substrate-binding protein, CUT2 family [Mycetocola miduiensis]
MKPSSSFVPAVALAGISALLLAGCASGGGSGRDDSGNGGNAEATRACVILPDAASSPRWENNDRPYLQKGLEDAGFETDIQNAQADVNKYATIADQQLTKGCGVMLLVDYNGAGAAVAEKAKGEGIPVIAYDRPIEGADYYVSFDNLEVGRLEGQSVVDGLTAAGKDPASAVVVYIGGDPADGNAKMFHDGAVEVMEAAGIKPAAEPPGVWDGDKSATNFEQALTSLGGKVDAVWAANDTNAAGVITILDKNGLTVPVSGQDASVAGLQNVLLGKQTATVYKPIKEEADAAIDLATALLKGETPEADQELEDGTPYIAVTPILVGPDEVKTVVAAGDADAEELCAGEVAAACEQYGVSG